MSGNASRTRGRQRELRYRDHLRDEGWWCERVDTPGVDLVAARAGERLYFFQVKSTVAPYAHFGPKDRAQFRKECREADAVGALIWWPRGKGLADVEWIDEASWP